MVKRRGTPCCWEVTDDSNPVWLPLHAWSVPTWACAGALAGVAASADLAGLALRLRLGLEAQHVAGLRRAGGPQLHACLLARCRASCARTCTPVSQRCLTSLPCSVWALMGRMGLCRA